MHVCFSLEPGTRIDLLPFSPISAAACFRCCRGSKGTQIEKCSWTSLTPGDRNMTHTLVFSLLWFLLCVAKQLLTLRITSPHIECGSLSTLYHKSECALRCPRKKPARDGSNCCVWGSSTCRVWTADRYSPSSRWTASRSGKRRRARLPKFNNVIPLLNFNLPPVDF